jgi:hypothetical protein
MTVQRPNDPNRNWEDPNRPMSVDSNLQADPEMREGRSGAGRVALYGLAIALLLGAVFYGLNNTSNDNTTAQAPAASRAADNSSGAVRDVSPNRESGVTTGAAPATQARPVQPPQSNPTGQQVDRAKGPAQ